MEKSQNPAQVNLITKCFIKPKSKQPRPSYHYLGPVDLGMLSMEPMQKGLLFTTPYEDHNTINSHNQIQLFLEKLKHSLCLSLDHFYPLAGQLETQKFPHEHASLIYVHCNKGHGASLIHGTVDLTVSDILSSTDVHPIVRSFFDLGEQSVNHDGHTTPLLSVQVTELLDGVFIGFTMNHSVGDGTSLWHFISTLNEIFLQYNGINSSSISITRKPIYDPFFPDGYGPMIKLPYLDPDEFIARFNPGPLRERIFHFSSSSMAKLKAKVNEAHEPGAHTISSFQALSGLVWRSIIKARDLKPNSETKCSLTANTRQRFDPPLSRDYFGNFLIGAKVTCKVGKLMGHGFSWAALLVSQIVKAQDDKVAREFLERFVESPYVAQLGTGSNNVVIAGSAKFDMYGPEFGLGKAKAVLAGYPNKEDGKVIANPGGEGRGSVDLEICLRPQTMNALELDEEFMKYVTF